jgi:hypothetical protein
LILLILLSTNKYADVRFVSKTGTSQFPYTSWQTASDSIQKCLNICTNGDTVIIGNGTYHENLVVKNKITIIGSSLDSTIIDGTGLTLMVISGNSDFSIMNLHIKGHGLWGDTYGIFNMSNNTHIENCRFTLCATAMAIGESSDTVKNVIVTDCECGVYSHCGTDTCSPVVMNSLIYIKQFYSSEAALEFYKDGNVKVLNNILIGNSADEGINSAYLIRSAEIKNNIIMGFITNSINVWYVDTMEIVNNTIGYQYENFGFGSVYYGNIYSTDKCNLRNNIFYKNWIAVDGPITYAKDYNLYFGNNQDFTSGRLNTHEIIADPMFVKDTIPSGTMNFDYHLQKYSPAIDSGDPTILDKDGSRSDIGYLGGPGGESYTYQDLAPRAPVGLGITQDSGKITLRWRKNTESDFKQYILFRDTVSNFTADSSRVISLQTDTIFTQLSSIGDKYYYKIKAEDNQGNKSELSEELGVITGIKNNPQVITEYRLFQNYPNPFNPGTIISYRLKESGYVKIMVYDIKGALVRVLLNETKQSGYYETEFNAKGLASGIYIYRIEVIGSNNIPKYSDMKKMILLK